MKKLTIAEQILEGFKAAAVIQTLRVLVHQLPVRIDIKEYLWVFATLVFLGIAVIIKCVSDRKREKENKKKEDVENRKIFLDQFQAGGGNE
jgi:putative Ca2+/H+ antiporter (TMEM165/GDT1 family)